MKHFDRFLPPELTHKLRQIRRLQHTISRVLPEAYRDRVKVGEIEGDRLTLVVDQQAVAANVRFQTDALQRAIRREHGIDIDRIRIKITPRSGPSPHAHEGDRRQRPPASAATKRHRERLRSVLRRLDEH